MPSLPSQPGSFETVHARAAVLFNEQLDGNIRRTDRMFAWLMTVQWLACIGIAQWISPKALEGRYSQPHIHLLAAIFLGGMIAALPVFLALRQPGEGLTRHVVAVGQMLTSGLLVQLTGGRIETHFHYYGSLAFLAFYLDWRVLVTATVVAATDHCLRSIFWPQSIFGVLAISPWRWLEPTAWILFEDAFLFEGIRQNLRGTFGLTLRQAKLEKMNETMERIVGEQTLGLKFGIAERKAVEMALQESKLFLQSMLDALPKQVAILDEGGTIIEANRAWKQFASDNNGPGQHYDIGDNYLESFDSAAGDFVPEALAAARGIREVKAGVRDDFQLEYLWRGSREPLWFAIRVTRLSGTDTLHLVVAHENITDRKLAEGLVRQSEERYRSVIENARDVIFTISADGIITSMNPVAESISGLSRAELVGRQFAPLVHPDDLPLAVDMFARSLFGEATPVYELRGSPNLKKEIVLEMTLSVQKDDQGNVIGIMGIGRDVTERKRLEAQLFQSQKLETVGRLAGGIAHEFNNIMTAIIGQSELLLEELQVKNPLRKNALEIRKAADRAAILTRQLLAYARKQILQPKNLNLNVVVGGMETVLRHLVGQNVDLRIVTDPGLKSVKADAGQIEQVIVNITLNAADAMPDGGKLTLETANVNLDIDYTSRFPELKPGEYVMLAITDTGAGMSKEVKDQLFEPFFTTKGVGKGNGLGLATSHGIVKQSGGHLAVYSEPGWGSTFKLYLPWVESSENLPASSSLPRGTETILLVEDDPALREMAAAILKRLGYRVFIAGNGMEALILAEQPDIGPVDLLFTDVVMPNMNGKELADRILILFANIKILFASAYTEGAISHHGVLDPGVDLLQKPFTPSVLAVKVREVLDAGKPAE